MYKEVFIRKCKLQDSVLEDFLNCHPSQIIPDGIELPITEVEYSYQTKRGNYKTTKKYLFLCEQDWDLAEMEFKEYIRRFNERHEDREISNVQILDIKYLGKVSFDFD